MAQNLLVLNEYVTVQLNQLGRARDGAFYAIKLTFRLAESLRGMTVLVCSRTVLKVGCICVLAGAGMFVTTIVVGAVTVTKPFVLTQRPFLRDIIFYIFAVFWTFFLLWNNSMTIFNAVGFVALYVFYVTVVIVGRIVFQQWKKWRKKTTLGTGDMPRE